MIKIREISIACALVACVSQAFADEAKTPYKGSIIDAHVHYSMPAWDVFPPARIMEKFDDADVTKAIVSSTPDTGTLTLHSHAPGRIIKFLRPYRTRADMGNWYADNDVLAYVQQKLAANSYTGFGEFHMYDPNGAATPQMKTILKLAVEKGLILQSHSGADVVEALLKVEPSLTVIWAHAGMSSPPAVIYDLFDRYPKVYADLSFRGDEMLGADGFDPAWKKVIDRFSDRLMIGSDTYINAQWSGYQELIDEHRRWLAYLPKETADAIASGNARKLLGP